jgi:hypothetical protein
MSLDSYFDTDDGSLQEIEVQFADPSQVQVAFGHLFSCGGIDVSVGGSCIWLTPTETHRAFKGPEDAYLVASGAADPFHMVLQGVKVAGTAIPALGVFVDLSSLTLDYRMGPHWGKAQMDALIALLRQLQGLGGSVSVPWCGADGEREFHERIGGA